MSDDVNAELAQAQQDQEWARDQLSQLRARVVYYPPTERAVWAHEAVRAATTAYGEILVGNCPPSEELYAALCKLTDEVMAHANAAIARHHDRIPSTAGSKVEYAVVPRTQTGRMSYKDEVSGVDRSAERRHPG